SPWLWQHSKSASEPRRRHSDDASNAITCPGRFGRTIARSERPGVVEEPGMCRRPLPREPGDLARRAVGVHAYRTQRSHAGLNSLLLNSKPGGGWPFRLTLKEFIGLFGH